ncbi:porin [Microvirga sp. ACRRW]|uniref:porin n=1 Tax=Microvirga sp. ACRRW TaxID=2918205 RepID=UPI001EF5CC21|nr:porin [Microvirga sp. ACRRW]MCG7391391.1 porin [Microvirga sp. ACRRW]
MKLVKSLLLGSVAGLAAIAGAQAADLPAKKAAAVEYVRVCSTYGEGFFYIPGTDTCLRVAGRVRAEYRYAEPDTRFDDSIGFRARGRIQLDSRTATAYGLLRTFVRFEITRDTGVYNSVPGTVTTSPDVDQAFIQFGGLTAGRAQTFFDNGDLDTQSFGTIRWSDQPNVNLLAYTFSFGNGFSATLSLEEPRFAGREALASSNGLLAGERAPDVVANLTYSGTWGSATVAGAVHQIRSIFPQVDTEYGFAVTGQATVNLPMLAAGDALWLAATYADGAAAYLGFGDEVQEATYNLNDGEIDTTRGWQVAAGLRHYWTPDLRSNLFGSFARIEYGSNTAFANSDFDEWRAGTNLIWTPVSGLDLGVEILYANDNPRAPGVRTTDSWEGRLRVQRDF